MYSLESWCKWYSPSTTYLLGGRFSCQAARKERAQEQSRSSRRWLLLDRRIIHPGLQLLRWDALTEAAASSPGPHFCSAVYVTQCPTASRPSTQWASRLQTKIKTVGSSSGSSLAAVHVTSRTQAARRLAQRMTSVTTKPAVDHWYWCNSAALAHTIISCTTTSHSQLPVKTIGCSEFSRALQYYFESILKRMSFNARRAIFDDNFEQWNREKGTKACRYFTKLNPILCTSHLS